MRLTSPPHRSHRPGTRGFGAALAAALLLVTAGCTGDAASSGDGKDGGKKSLVDRAPVAAPQVVAASESAQAIQERGELLVGGVVDMPLMSQRNPASGQTRGFDALLAKMLAKYITGKPNTKKVTAVPETREALLQVGTVDVVIRIYSITKERAKKVSFAGPYLFSGQAIATLKGTSDIQGADDLAGNTVVALTGSTSADAVREAAPAAELKTYRTSRECVQALERGTADAYVHDLTVLAGIAQLNNKLKIIGEPFTNEPYGIGIQRGDTAFKKFINDWLRKIQSMGLWKKAWQQTLGTVVEGDPPKPPEIGSVPGS